MRDIFFSFSTCYDAPSPALLLRIDKKRMDEGNSFMSTDASMGKALGTGRGLLTIATKDCRRIRFFLPDGIENSVRAVQTFAFPSQIEYTFAFER